MHSLTQALLDRRLNSVFTEPLGDYPGHEPPFYLGRESVEQPRLASNGRKKELTALQSADCSTVSASMEVCCLTTRVLISNYFIIKRFRRIDTFNTELATRVWQREVT